MDQVIELECVLSEGGDFLIEDLIVMMEKKNMSKKSVLLKIKSMIQRGLVTIDMDDNKIYYYHPHLAYK